MHDARRDLVGIAGFQRLFRLPVDEEIELAFEHVTGLDARMGMATGRAARRDLRDGGDGVVAIGKFDLLERGALDAGLLGEGRNSEAGEGESEQSLFEHGFSSLERLTLAAPWFPARLPAKAQG